MTSLMTGVMTGVKAGVMPFDVMMGVMTGVMTPVMTSNPSSFLGQLVSLEHFEENYQTCVSSLGPTLHYGIKWDPRPCLQGGSAPGKALTRGKCPKDAR